MKKEKSWEYHPTAVNSHGIMIPFQQTVLEIGYAREGQVQAIQNMPTPQGLSMDIKILLYFFMPVHLIASIARTGISEMKH